MPEIANEHLAHHELGASTAKRWLNCAGSIRMIAAAPPPVPSRYAAEGTLAHSLAAHILQNEGRLGIYKVGTVHEVEGFQIEITEEMFDAVTVYTDFINDLIAEHHLQPEHVYIETRVHIPGVGFGTADAILVLPYRKIICIDYKHGQGVSVSVENNEQAMYYLAGAVESLENYIVADIDEYEMVIVQPRCPGAGISRCTVTREDLDHFKDTLIVGAVRTRQPDAPVNAGDWCKFCPAASTCPALRQEVARVAAIDFDTSEYHPPSVESTTPEQLANIMAAEEMIVDFLRAAKSRAQGLMEAGTPVPGYKLVSKKSNRVWKPETEDAIVSILTGIHTVPGEELYSAPKFLSPAQLEKVIRQHGVSVNLTPYIDKPDNGKTIAKDTDARSARAGNAIEDFAEVNVIDLV